MKKILVSILAVVALISLTIAVSAAGYTAKVGDFSGSHGDTVTVTVEIDESVQVTSGSVRISYDTSVLELHHGSWHILGDVTESFDSNRNTGSFTANGVSSVGGSVFSAYFVIKSDAELGNTEVALNLTLYDAYGSPIDIENISGHLTVKCRHIFDRQEATPEYWKSDATCTEKARYYYSCSSCGAKGTETFEYGNLLPHTYNQQVTTADYEKSPATCTAKAVYYYSCTCGAKGEETFEYGELLPHTYNQQVTTADYEKSPATCTEAAVYYYSCVCGAKGSETFESGEALGHIGGTASCTERAVCDRCKQPYGNKEPHVFDREVIEDKYLKSPATCTSRAVYYYSCVCGEMVDETFEYGDVLPHTYDQRVATPDYWKSDATCTEKARYYYSCTCGAKGTETFEYGELEPHDYNQQVTTADYEKSPATCTEAAVYYYSCVCGDKGTETFEFGGALGHTGGTNSCTEKAVCDRCHQPYGDLLPHTYDQRVAAEAYLKSPATCTSKAVYYYSCICGGKGTESFEDGEPLPHTYDQQVAAEAYLKSPATCTSRAIYYYSCTCGAKGTKTFEYGNLEPHTYNQRVTTAVYEKYPATCTEAAVYYYSCVCGAKGTETFESGQALGHTGGTATCTARAICTRCQQPYGDILPHDYSMQVTTENYLKSPATCTEAAVYYYSCACGLKSGEEFSFGEPLGHTGGTATCTKKAVCDRCQRPYGEPLPHAYNQEVVSERYKRADATCTSGETYYKSCVCGASGNAIFAIGEALGHIGGTATCSAQAICDRCQQPYGETLPHVFDREVISEAYKKSDADCLNAAVYYVSCVCGARGTDTFVVGEALGHLEEIDAAVEATCTTPGLTEGAHCSRCGQILKAQEEIPALGHQYDEWVPEKEPDCTEPGEESRDCDRCDQEETRQIDPVGHKWKDATCTAPKTCETCGKTEGQKLDHNFGQWDDGDKIGQQEHTCTDCGQTETAACCMLCGRHDLLISVIPLCLICLLIMLLILLAATLLVWWLLRRTHKKQDEEENEQKLP